MDVLVRFISTMYCLSNTFYNLFTIPLCIISILYVFIIHCQMQDIQFYMALFCNGDNDI